MTDQETSDHHRRIAISYYNVVWDLIETPDRTPEQDREMLTAAFASRQHWLEANPTEQNLTVADWQVAHVASLAGLADTAMAFAAAAAERAAACGAPVWLQASTHEGLARAYAAAGNRAGYDYEAHVSRSMLHTLGEDEDRRLVESQLASIPLPS